MWNHVRKGASLASTHFYGKEVRHPKTFPTVPCNGAG